MALKLAVNVGGMLIVFTALVAMVNWMMANWIGDWTGLNTWIAQVTDGVLQSLSLQFLFGMLFAPDRLADGRRLRQSPGRRPLLGKRPCSTSSTPTSPNEQAAEHRP
jgi:hypothetical protein